MFRRATTLLSNPFRMFSGGHHGPAPTKLEKMSGKIIWINVKNTAGAYERVPAFEGESLMGAMLRNKTLGFVGRCTWIMQLNV